MGVKSSMRLGIESHRAQIGRCKGQLMSYLEAENVAGMLSEVRGIAEHLACIRELEFQLDYIRDDEE